MPDFNVADGSINLVRQENSPVALVKGYQPNTWFYAPRAARIARDGTNAPLFTVVRNQRKKAGSPGEFETLGGVFSAQLDLTVPLPELPIQEQWSEYITASTNIRPIGSNSFRYQPMRLYGGTMNIVGMDQLVVDPSKLVNVPVSAGPTVAVALELNSMGADTFATALRNKSFAGFPLAVVLKYNFDVILPQCHCEIKADTKRVFEFFSLDAKARASYFGLFGGQADVNVLRQNLQTSGAITINMIAPPQGMAAEQVKKLQDSLIDIWTRATLAQITTVPHADPAVAPDPKGFFGGVSVAMKDWKDVQAMSLSATYDYSALIQDTYMITYAVGPLLKDLDPAKYLLDIHGDNQLPLVVSVGGDPRVIKYSAQFGYKRADGVTTGHALPLVPGTTGGVLSGVLQWPEGEPEPHSASIAVSVDWTDPNWEDRTDVFTKQLGEQGVQMTWSPGVNIADVAVMTDLAQLEPGWLATINWKSVMPTVNGVAPKTYTGRLILSGSGSAGTPNQEIFQFPYVESAGSNVKVAWSVTIFGPNGEKLQQSGEQEPGGTIAILRSMFFARDGKPRTAIALNGLMTAFGHAVAAAKPAGGIGIQPGTVAVAVLANNVNGQNGGNAPNYHPSLLEELMA